jgi:serine/threonine protein kinase
VMTARPRAGGPEVAVKFIEKSKVPNSAWMEHEEIGRLPSEIMLLSLVQHKNIVRCLDVFEDPLYFYLVRRIPSHILLLFVEIDDRIWI